MARSFAVDSTDRVQITNYAAISNVDIESYSFWIYTTGWGTNVNGRVIDDNLQRLTFLHDNFTGSIDGALRFIGRRRDGQWWVEFNSTTHFNNWLHVGITMDNGSTANDPTIYFDGVSQTINENITPTIGLDSASPDINFGNNSTNTRAFQGRIAEMAGWDVLLTREELETARLFGPQAVGHRPIFYLPLHGIHLPEPNLVSQTSKTNGTLTGTGQADHAPAGPAHAKSYYYYRRAVAAVGTVVKDMIMGPGVIPFPR